MKPAIVDDWIDHDEGVRVLELADGSFEYIPWEPDGSPDEETDTMTIHALRQRSLRALADCLEGQSGKDLELDRDIASAVGVDKQFEAPRYTSSTSCAISLYDGLDDDERFHAMHCAVDSFAKVKGQMKDWPRWISAAALRGHARQIERQADAA